MIRTPICDLLDIQHPTALGGMGSASSTAMTAAVSQIRPLHWTDPSHADWLAAHALRSRRA